MPEISIIDDSNATGVWAMYDWVDDPDHGRAFQGYGHYRERYRRGSDGNWRISELRLERIRVTRSSRAGEMSPDNPRPAAMIRQL